jgi:hypothetical protein
MRRLACALVLCSAASSVGAASYNPDFSLNCSMLSSTCQSDFREVAHDVAAALNYKPLGPAESSGITGIAVGLIGTYVSADSEAWERLTGVDVQGLGMAGIVARKGLPFDIDVGAFYAGVPGGGVSAYGGELRWALLGGGIAEPAIAVRGSFTRTSGIDDFDFDSYGLDVSVSKGFTILTPYIGYGYVWAEADPHDIAGLEKQEVEEGKLFVGARIGLGLLDITPEYERLGDRNVYNLLIGLSF